jgi:TonB family protein
MNTLSSRAKTIAMKPVRVVMMLLLMLPCVIVYAQRDTVFLNFGSRPTKKRAEAEYYRFLGSPEFGRCKVEDFYLSGKRKKVFFVSSKDTATLDGNITSYYENGQKEYTGSYISGTQSGIWKTYFKDTNAIWQLIEYFPYGGDTTGILKSFYRSGKLKRIEYEGKNDLDTGVCYNEDGTEKKFTRFQAMPKADYIWQQFVKREIKYPRKSVNEGIYGRVNVRFTVSKNGRIYNVKALNDPESELAKEAVRVVSLFPDWIPGVQDDETVDVFFTVPITYKFDD